MSNNDIQNTSSHHHTLWTMATACEITSQAVAKSSISDKPACITSAPQTVNFNPVLPSIIAQLSWNGQHIYRINRGLEVFMLQQNVGQLFWNNSSTFNSVCWVNKIAKVPATSEELQKLKSLGAIEKGTRKANLMLLDTVIKLFHQTKKTIDTTVFHNFVLTGTDTFSSAKPFVDDTLSHPQPASQHNNNVNNSASNNILLTDNNNNFNSLHHKPTSPIQTNSTSPSSSSKPHPKSANKQNKVLIAPVVEKFKTSAPPEPVNKKIHSCRN